MKERKPVMANWYKEDTCLLSLRKGIKFSTTQRPKYISNLPILQGISALAFLHSSGRLWKQGEQNRPEFGVEIER